MTVLSSLGAKGRRPVSSLLDSLVGSGFPRGGKEYDGVDARATTYQDSRRAGCFLASDSQGGRSVKADGREVRRIGGLLAQAARTREGEVEAGPVQAGDRQVVGVGPVDAAQAAPYRDASLAPAAGRAWLRGLVPARAALCAAAEAGLEGPGRRFHGTAMGAGHRAGRFRRRPGLHQGSSGEGALPGGGVPVFEHALGGRAARGECRMRVRGFGDRVRAYRPGAARAGVRQRHRRRAPGRVGQNHHRGRVPTVRRALPGRGQVPQPGQRVGEGQRGERGRVPQAQPHGPHAQRGIAPETHLLDALALRRDCLEHALPQGCSDLGPVRRGEDAHAAVAPGPVRRVPLGDAQGRPGGQRRDRFQPLPRRPLVARMDPGGRFARVPGGDPHPGRPVRGQAAARVRQGRPDGEEPGEPAARFGAQVARVGRIPHPRRFLFLFNRKLRF